MQQLMFMDEYDQQLEDFQLTQGRDLGDMTSLYTQDIYNMPDLDVLNEFFANQNGNLPDGPMQKRYMKEVYDQTRLNMKRILLHKKDVKEVVHEKQHQEDQESEYEDDGTATSSELSMGDHDEDLIKEQTDDKKDNDNQEKKLQNQNNGLFKLTQQNVDQQKQDIDNNNNNENDNNLEDQINEDQNVNSDVENQSDTEVLGKLEDVVRIFQDETEIQRYQKKSQFENMYQKQDRHIHILSRNMQAKDQYEILRLSKEFQQNGYQQRYNVSPIIVFTALFGLTMAEKELQVQGLLDQQGDFEDNDIQITQKGGF